MTGAVLLAVAAEAPNTADWIAAVAAAVAAVAAVGAAVFTVGTLRAQRRTLQLQSEALADERRTRRAELERIAAEQQEAAAAQARTIVLHDVGCGGMQFQWVRDYQLTMGNYGDRPVTAVRARLQQREGGGIPVELPVVPVLAGGQRQQLRWQLDAQRVVWPAGMPPHELPGLFTVEVDFVDVHGNQWRAGLGTAPQRIVDEVI